MTTRLTEKEIAKLGPAGAKKFRAARAARSLATVAPTTPAISASRRSAQLDRMLDVARGEGHRGASALARAESLLTIWSAKAARK